MRHQRVPCGACGLKTAHLTRSPRLSRDFPPPSIGRELHPVSRGLVHSSKSPRPGAPEPPFSGGISRGSNQCTCRLLRSAMPIGSNHPSSTSPPPTGHPCPALNEQVSHRVQNASPREAENQEITKQQTRETLAVREEKVTPRLKKQ